MLCIECHVGTEKPVMSLDQGWKRGFSTELVDIVDSGRQGRGESPLACPSWSGNRVLRKLVGYLAGRIFDFAAGPSELAACRKFFSRCLPSLVRMDSGWNCTPSIRCCLWRKPITTPSAVVAEI